MRTDRIFARLQQEPERPDSRVVPQMSRVRAALFGTSLVLYTAIVIAVLRTTDLVMLDWQVMLFRPYRQWPVLHPLLDYFVVMGQRGPTAVLVAAWLGWRSWRQRTLRPLLVLGTSLLLLNCTVGAVKIGLGRLGPHYATTVGSSEMFAGGGIFPSGHTANAVVTWGVLAYLATTPTARRVLSVIAAFFALGVGTTTVYLGTHWLSDVLLGWTAGLLILLALPWFEPGIIRTEAAISNIRDRLRSGARRRLPVAMPPVAAPVPAHAPLVSRAHGRASTARRVPENGDGEGSAAGAAGAAAELLPGAGAPGPHAASSGSASSGTNGPGVRGAEATRPHHTVRSYPVRSERAPVTPVSGRRPQHPERPVTRTAPLGPRN